MHKILLLNISPSALTNAVIEQDFCIFAILSTFKEKKGIHNPGAYFEEKEITNQKEKSNDTKSLMKHSLNKTLQKLMSKNNNALIL